MLCVELNLVCGAKWKSGKKAISSRNYNFNMILNSLFIIGNANLVRNMQGIGKILYSLKSDNEPQLYKKKSRKILPIPCIFLNKLAFQIKIIIPQ